MSDHKAAIQGADHKRIPDNVADNPTLLGHEFAGELLEVGAKWRHAFEPGQRFTVQTALNYKGSLDAPGYSYQYIGGNATHVIIPNEVMEMNCLLPFSGDAFFYASLAEPMSCIIGSYHATYHTTAGSYDHKMGIVKGGKLALLAAAGPMGMGAVDYAIHCDRRPGMIVVVDIDEARLSRAARLLPVDEAARHGVKLVYLNTNDADELIGLSGGLGYDDVFAYAPVAPVIELGDRILGKDGCLNFFAGPVNPSFSAPINFYNVHYASTHIMGTTGGNTSDMIEALAMMEQGLINPAAMITHVGGLDSAIGATMDLNKVPGGKRLIYTHVSMPLTAIDELESMDEPLYRKLAEIVKDNNGLWCAGAEKYLLK